MNTDCISVFFPCINEEGNIENTVIKAEGVLKKLNLKYEIIIIDDGSTDKTGQIADNLAKENSNIRVIHHPKNLGYGEALKSGFYNARFETIVYTDGDGQFDFAEVTKFLDKINEYDLIIGYRIKRRDPFVRILFKEGWRMSLLTFFGLTLKDVDCGFKMIRREVLERIPHLESTRGAMINAELAIKAKTAGFKIAEVGVTHYPRLSGKPTGANLQVIIKSFFDLLRLYWKLKDQKFLFILLLCVIFLAAFFRFYRISEYMNFLGDEGRDAIVIKDLLVNHHFPFIGPPTSVGNIYLGPLYYYMMAVPMAIFWLNPVAAAGMNAFFGIITIVLIYLFGKHWFNREAGLIAAYLYAISPVTIIYSRSSWNPNPAPFFALISMFSLYKIHKTGNFLWLILTGLAVGAAMQMHYLAAILIPIIGILWLYEILYRNRKKLKIKHFLSGPLLGLASFLLTLLPMIVFDLRHDFLNSRAIIRLFSAGTAVKGDIFENIQRIPFLYTNNLIGRYIGGENFYISVLVSLLIIATLIYKYSSWPKIALGVWLIIGLFGLTFYQQNIYDHYFGFLNPAPFLLIGSLTVLQIPGWKKSNWFATISLGFLLILLTIVNLQKSPLLFSPNNQLKRTQDIAKFIINQTGGKDFNFALLSKNNYDSAYQFYLDLYGYKPKQLQYQIADQLIVVCEDSICEPINNPKYEISAFGWAKITSEQNFEGVKIYSLAHNPLGKPN